MDFDSKRFGIVLKNARMDKKLTQAELAEELDISLSYLKDLEGFRNSPSLELFEKIIRYFNLSADCVVYPKAEDKNSAYEQLQRLLTRCDNDQITVLIATAEAMLSLSEHKSDAR
ncbi:MAG: helix-turn-helix domain-containing protein [Lachnospiraceae bacterium]|nr:helix-turn-helix domain-containing protein [Lachnospiraceae bacterium]MCD7841754.1 helix-turn-helix domain-containing protein [Lachnospiraceae bacterium]